MTLEEKPYSKIDNCLFVQKATDISRKTLKKKSKPEISGKENEQSMSRTSMRKTVQTSDGELRGSIGKKLSLQSKDGNKPRQKRSFA